jgi:hypothetical protein
VENKAFIFKANEGKTFRGICITVCGQAFILGASLRGYFWRFKANICRPKPGYSESIFALRTKLIIKAGMIDELVPLRIYPISFDSNRNARIHSIMHISKHGLLTMSFREMDASAFSQVDSKILEGFAGAEADDMDTSFYNYEERD